MLEPREEVVERPRLSAMEVLARAASAVHGSLSVEQKVQWVAESVRAVTGASLAAIVGLRREPGDLTAVVGASSYDVDTYARPALARAITALTTAREIDPGPRLLRDKRFRTFLKVVDLPDGSGLLCVPVPAVDAQPHAALLAAHPDPNHFDQHDRTAASALASHLGVALDNQLTLTRLTEQQALQREVVHELQKAVRPPMPAVNGAELGVHYLPADPSGPMGGDLYDWMVLPDGDLHLAVVDVMGKGVGATKEAVAVTHALRLLVLDGCPIDDLIRRADELLLAHNPDLVATVVVARYSPEDGKLVLAGGGQPPPLLVTATGEVTMVTTPGVAVGWPGAGSNGIVETTLDRHDTLVLYTDGLIEATKDVLVGLDNLTRAATHVARYPSGHVARALVERSLSGAMRRDDCLALVLRRRTAPAPDRTPVLGPFEYKFSPSTATVPLGRHLLSDWLEHLSMDDSERADLLLVASELCSNAVRHASGAPGALALRAWAEGDAVVVEVEDDGEGFEHSELYDDELPDPDVERGRGLYVVGALTDEIAVRREDERTIVRAVRRAVLPEN